MTSPLVCPTGSRHGPRIDLFCRSGLSYVSLENALVKIVVCLSKGADIVEWRLKSTDVDVLWSSDSPEMMPGTYVQPSEGLPFLDYFRRGWQEILPNGGAACSIEGAPLGMHGEVALLPWRVVEISGDADFAQVTLAVDTVRTPFSLTKRFTLKADSSSAQVTETLTNTGRTSLPYMWGQHPGFGAPFLEPGCCIDLEGGIIRVPQHDGRPSTRIASQTSSEWPFALSVDDGPRVTLDRMPEDDARCDDFFYLQNLTSGWIALRNDRLCTGAALEWDLADFPYVWVWLVAHGVPGYPFFGRYRYLALEPFNCPPGTLADNAQAGVSPVLEGGESKNVTWHMTLFEANASCVTSVRNGMVKVSELRDSEVSQ